MKTKALCEICNIKEAIFFSFNNNEWEFTCELCDECPRYYAKISNFFKSKSATIDWLAHLSEKPWINWNDFMSMMHRYRKATNSFNCL
jgi:hypothetical protein